MEIKAADVMKLRKMTGAGMMDCKSALMEAEGDYEKAKDIIREKGKLVANKRADRTATEGVVVTKIAGQKAYMLCLACETDFVAKNSEFSASANQILEIAVKNDVADLNPSGCWSFEAVFTKQAQPDFQGTLCGGSSVVFEAKATDKDRIMQSAVTEEQARALESHANMGALAFVLVCLRGRAVYSVMWEDWQNMKELFGHKYMTAVELEPYRVQLRQGVIRFLGDPE